MLAVVTSWVESCWGAVGRSDPRDWAVPHRVGVTAWYCGGVIARDRDTNTGSAGFETREYVLRNRRADVVALTAPATLDDEGDDSFYFLTLHGANDPRGDWVASCKLRCLQGSAAGAGGMPGPMASKNYVS